MKLQTRLHQGLKPAPYLSTTNPDRRGAMKRWNPLPLKVADGFFSTAEKHCHLLEKSKYGTNNATSGLNHWLDTNGDVTKNYQNAPAINPNSSPRV